MGADSNSEIKAVVITHIWNKYGGTENHVKHLVEAMERKNTDVTVIFRSGSDEKNKQISGNKIIFVMKSLLTLAKIKPKIVHAHATWFTLCPGVMYKLIKRDSNLMFRFHSFPERAQISRLERWSMRLLLQQCTLITFVSQGLKKEYETLYNIRFARCEVTYAGVTGKKICEQEIESFRDRYRIGRNSFILLAQSFTASKVKADGAKILIEVISVLREEFSDILLLITKKGKYSADLKLFATQKGVDRNIIFTGDIGNPFIPLALCDIYTHISLGDGLPLSLLEAMSMGKPIIATPIGGIPEAIQHEISGLLVEPNVEKICENIRYLRQNNEAARSLGKNAQHTADEKFGWNNWDTAISTMYSYYKF